MPFSSKAVANYFLERAWQSGRNLDPMQIQKLVYIAHGWHLAREDKPLVEESFEAWKYGPVERSLYAQFKRYGDGPIRNLATHHLSTPIVPSNAIDTHKVLDFVWKKYGGLSGPNLAHLTHKPGTPWDRTKIQDGSKISNEVIARHYKELDQSESLKD